MKLAAFVLVAGCGNLLGLAAPQEQIDGGSNAIDAGPVTIHVITGGTAGSAAGSITSEPTGIACPGTCNATFAAGTSVMLTSTVTAPTFTGFIGGDCSGTSPTCTIAPTGDTTIFARYFGTTNVVFTSSTQQAPGSFDVVGNADALCNQLATAAGVPGTFAAWLSTSGSAAGDRLQAAAPQGLLVSEWARPDGQLFANQLSDLEAGQILFPARLDELGRDVGDTAVAVTDTDGTGAAGSSTHCQDWSSTGTAGNVLAGEPVGGTDRWTAVTSIACDQPSHIYCLGANGGNQPAPTPLTQAIVYVSRGTIAGNAGVAAADTLCTNEAQAAHLPNAHVLALITPGGGQPVKKRFETISIPTPVQRPDTIELAASGDALIDGSAWAASPNVAADGTFLDVDTWTGGSSLASFVADCTGWTKASDVGATRPAATTLGTNFSKSVSCTETKHVLCMNFTGTVR